MRKIHIQSVQRYLRRFPNQATITSDHKGDHFLTRYTDAEGVPRDLGKVVGIPETMWVNTITGELHEGGVWY